MGFKKYRQNYSGNIFHSFEARLERLIHDIDLAKKREEEKKREERIKEARKFRRIFEGI